MSRNTFWLWAIGCWMVGSFSASAFAAEDNAASAADAKATSTSAAANASTPAAAVADNMDVALEYTLAVDGAVIESTEGKQPLHYVHGKGKIIPGLEHQLAGMHVGDAKEITVSPEEGYGQIDPSAVVEVDKAKLPPDTVPAVGMVLRGVNPDGQMFRARIKEIKDDKVILDLNHPLAGKTLTFKVKIVSITPATTGG